MNEIDYPMIIRRLTDEEGGSFLVEFPDLPGCMADGETVEEAIAESHDALISWLETAKAHRDFIPSSSNRYSGQWRLRVPKSLHAALALRAKQEDVSLNMLAATLLAKGIGHQELRN